MRWEMPSGLVDQTVRDAVGRVLQRGVADATGRPVLRRTLVWGESGLDAVDEWSSAGAVGRSDQSTHHRFTHDAAGRVTSWRTNDGEFLGFKHDALNNLVEAPGRPARKFEGDGRPVSDEGGGRFRWDEFGRLVGASGPQGQRTFFYDEDDLLETVHVKTLRGEDRLVRHTYDALGRRVRSIAELPDGRVTEERLLWEGDRVAVRTVGPLGAPAEALRVEEYVWDPDASVPLCRVVTVGGKSERQLYVVDQRGAAVALLDDRGRTLWNGDYDAYGRCVESGVEASTHPRKRPSPGLSRLTPSGGPPSTRASRGGHRGHA